MKKIPLMLLVAIFTLSLASCSIKYENKAVETIEVPVEAEEVALWENIDFSEDEMYAVAYIGYTEYSALEEYKEIYLGYDVDIHIIHDAEYYLIIPKDSYSSLKIYENDINSDAKILRFESQNARPFLIGCNASDIFPSSTIEIAGIEFSPYESLKDGSIQVGEYGKLISLE